MEGFNTGDKVISKYTSADLTEGVVYTIGPSIYAPSQSVGVVEILLLNDKGLDRIYPVNLFISVKEYRINVLSELLG
jgi:hypothetical protein